MKNQRITVRIKSEERKGIECLIKLGKFRNQSDVLRAGLQLLVGGESVASK